MAIKKGFLFQTLLISIVLIIVAIVSASAFFYWLNSKNDCINPYEVKDSTSGKEAIRLCGSAFYRGSIKIVDSKEFPDLFKFYLNKDSKPDKVKQSVRVFTKDKTEYVSIVSLIDYNSWNNSAIAIYKKNEDGYVPIFKKTFTDNQGRWVNIQFGEDYTTRDPYFYLSQPGEGFTISGDLGYLGCLGACRMLWWDFYDWDSDKKMFVLSNNKHADNFKKLLESYQDLDKNTCLNETNLNKSIAELYPFRKDKQKFCGDEAIVPYTTPEQAEMLLKGIKAIKKIIGGENISITEVDSVGEAIQDCPITRLGIAKTEIVSEKFNPDQPPEGQKFYKYSEDDSIWTETNFDVDQDGIAERVLTTKTAMNHTPHVLRIVKNGNVIFKFDGAGLDAVPVEDSDGFILSQTIDWNKEIKRQTRYDYDSGKFIPVWYQEGCQEKIN